MIRTRSSESGYALRPWAGGIGAPAAGATGAPRLLTITGAPTMAVRLPSVRARQERCRPDFPAHHVRPRRTLGHHTPIGPLTGANAEQPAPLSREADLSCPYAEPMKKWVVLASTALGLAGLVAFVVSRGPRVPLGAEATIARIRASSVTGVVIGESGYAQSGGVRIWYESRPAVGAEKGVVLLNIALGASSLYWPPAFLRALTAGRIPSHQVRPAGYRCVELDAGLEQATSVLVDRHGGRRDRGPRRASHRSRSRDRTLPRRVHRPRDRDPYPGRVQSLTLMSTSADPTDASMPGPRTWPLIVSALTSLPLLRYRVLGGETNLVKELLASLVAQGGDDPVDVEEWTKIVLYDLRERGGLNVRSLRQHQVAVAVTRSRYPLMGMITAPTLVIHGTRDTFLPIEHGHRLAAAIPSAYGLWLDIARHAFPYPNMREVTSAITNHLYCRRSRRLRHGARRPQLKQPCTRPGAGPSAGQLRLMIRYLSSEVGPPHAVVRTVRTRRCRPAAGWLSRGSGAFAAAIVAPWRSAGVRRGRSGGRGHRRRCRSAPS